MYSEKALKSGLLNEIYTDKDQLINSVYKIARDISYKSPLAVSSTKKIIKYSLDHSIHDSLDYVALWNSNMLQSDDFYEAISAKIQKRNAKFDDIYPSPNLIK